MRRQWHILDMQAGNWALMVEERPGQFKFCHGAIGTNSATRHDYVANAVRKLNASEISAGSTNKDSHDARPNRP